MKNCLIFVTTFAILAIGCDHNIRRIEAPDGEEIYRNECLSNPTSSHCEEVLKMPRPGIGAGYYAPGVYGGAMPQMYQAGYSEPIQPLLPNLTCTADYYGNEVCGAIPYTETGNAPNPGDTPNGRLEHTVRQNREQIQNLNEHQHEQDRCINGGVCGGSK